MILEKILEMNEYEKMSSEIIKEKEKVDLDFGKTYIITVTFLMALFVIFGIFLVYKEKIDFEQFFIQTLLSGFISLFLGIFFTGFFYEFLKILNLFTLFKDKEYQLAKEVMLNYSKKVEEKKKRNECIDVIQREKEKHERIYGLERYLEDERKGK